MTLTLTLTGQETMVLTMAILTLEVDLEDEEEEVFLEAEICSQLPTKERRNSSTKPRTPMMENQRNSNASCKNVNFTCK